MKEGTQQSDEKECGHKSRRTAVSNLNITVNSYSGLWNLLHNHYSGRLVDVLELKME